MMGAFKLLMNRDLETLFARKNVSNLRFTKCPMLILKVGGRVTGYWYSEKSDGTLR